jgi:acyl carrier protein
MRKMFLTTESITDRVKFIIQDVMNIEIDKIHEDSLFIDDFELDSLDMVELVLAIEEEFEFDIPDKDLNSMINRENNVTVGELINYIKDHFGVQD